MRRMKWEVKVMGTRSWRWLELFRGACRCLSVVTPPIDLWHCNFCYFLLFDILIVELVFYDILYNTQVYICYCTFNSLPNRHAHLQIGNGRIYISPSSSGQQNKETILLFISIKVNKIPTQVQLSSLNLVNHTIYSMPVASRNSRWPPAREKETSLSQWRWSGHIPRHSPQVYVKSPHYHLV